jgi:ABC-type branched-subunit amino acid transport system ATPase component
MAELLRVQGLRAGYGEAVVLQGVDFTLDQGQTLALLGRNGTGKTTLINTVAGATRQHCGTQQFNRGPRRGGGRRTGSGPRRRPPEPDPEEDAQPHRRRW